MFAPGDEVFYAGSLIRPGSNSQFQAVDERIVGKKPRTLGFAEAFVGGEVVIGEDVDGGVEIGKRVPVTMMGGMAVGAATSFLRLFRR